MKTQVTESNELIDYDAEFRTYLEKWYEENKQDFEKPEEVEQLLPELYHKWMHKNCAALEKMPAEWGVVCMQIL